MVPEVKSSSSSQTGTMSSSSRKKDLMEGLKTVCLLLMIPLVFYVMVATIVQTVKRDLAEQPATYSVELVGAKGIRSALDPAAEESPAFKLLVRVDNGHIYGVSYAGGHLIVSYAGVPLARGSIPAFRVETKKKAAVAVDAASYGIGIPEDLFRRMSEDRTSAGVAQLQVELWLRHVGFFTCDVDMDTEHHRASHCHRHNLIYSS